MQRILARTLLLALLCATVQAQEWQDKIRLAARENQLQTALDLANDRLAQAPDDWEALGWHARILSWQGKWAIAESEYRHVLDKFPTDTDILLGLADVLFWQGKYEEANTALERATRAGAQNNDVQNRRARILAQQHPVATSVASVTVGESRPYELRIGNDTDVFNFTGPANAQSLSLLVTWNHRWRSALTGQTFQRFGSFAQKVGASASYGISPHSYITVGASTANKQDVISRFDENVEFGRTLPVRIGLLHGLETVFEQRALWFLASQVTIVRSSAILDLPRDSSWTLTFSDARSQFNGITSTSWRPSGSSKLTFPVHRHVDANVLYAVGSENYAAADQIGQFSAHTYGGGLRFHLTPFQDISTYGAFQDRSQGRTQTSIGFNYGIRF